MKNFKNIFILIFYLSIFSVSFANEKIKETGTEYTRFIHRLETRYRYEDFKGDRRRHRLLFRYTRPSIRKQGEFRLDFPLAYNKEGSDKEYGLGDIKLRGNFLLVDKQFYRTALALEFIFDSASDETLGRGKNQIAPWFIFTYMPTKNKRIRLMPIFKYAKSVGGDPDRDDINELFFRPIFEYQSLSNYWVRVDPQFIFVFEDSDDSHLFFKLQSGKMLRRNFGIWVEIATDQNKDGLIRNTIEFGTRFLF